MIRRAKLTAEKPHHAAGVQSEQTQQNPIDPDKHAEKSAAQVQTESVFKKNQRRAADPVAMADAYAPPRVQTLEGRFRTFWTHAMPDPELRRLKI